MRLYPILSAAIVVAVAALVLNVTAPSSHPPESNITVTAVVDGDTITIAGGERVRLLGIDTRERGEPCYEEAKQFLKDLVEMKDVRLEADAENKDRYGRLLRHVWLNRTHVNLEIMRQGLAVALSIEPNAKYKSEIAAAEREARENKIGCLWQ